MKIKTKTWTFILLIVLAIGSSVFSIKASATGGTKNLAQVGNCVRNGVVYAFNTICTDGGTDCTATSCP